MKIKYLEPWIQQEQTFKSGNMFLILQSKIFRHHGKNTFFEIINHTEYFLINQQIEIISRIFPIKYHR